MPGVGPASPTDFRSLPAKPPQRIFNGSLHRTCVRMSLPTSKPSSIILYRNVPALRAAFRGCSLFGHMGDVRSWADPQLIAISIPVQEGVRNARRTWVRSARLQSATIEAASSHDHTQPDLRRETCPESVRPAPQTSARSPQNLHNASSMVPCTVHACACLCQPRNRPPSYSIVMCQRCALHSVDVACSVMWVTSALGQTRNSLQYRSPYKRVSATPSAHGYAPSACRAQR